jgi:hypothetical protein
VKKRGIVVAVAVGLVAVGAAGISVTQFGSERQVRPDTATPTFEVSTGRGWSIIRNGPGGLAIGNARNGWTMVGRDKGTYGYVVGFLTGPGNFSQCAWIDRNNLRRVGAVRDSGCEWLRYSRKFISQINCQGCAGGTPVRLIRATGEYANYSARSGFRDGLRGAPKGRCVEWRWVSKRGSAVMVLDRTYNNGDAHWIFVRRSALPTRLPRGSQGICPKKPSAA